MSGQQILDRTGRCTHWRQRIVMTRYVCFDCKVDCGEVGSPPATMGHVDLADYPFPVTEVEVPTAAIGYLDGGPVAPIVPLAPIIRPAALLPQEPRIETRWAGPRAPRDGRRAKGGVLPYVDTRTIKPED